jgi:hypothetical protein
MSLNLGIIASSRGTAAPPVGLLLDAYPGAEFAFSFRKLRSAYTGNCVRIRRSSDNAAQNFGFVNNYVDTISISTFCGSGNGFLITWYDQSGNSNNAVNTTSPPQIYFSGAFVLRSGKIDLQFINLQFLVLVNTIVKTSVQNYSFWTTYQKSNSGNQPLFLRSGDYLWLDYGQTNQYINSGLQSINITPNNYAINTRYLVNHICDTQNVTIYSNSNAWGNRITTFGTAIRNFVAESGINGIVTINEFVFYSSSQAANRTGINSNINTFYTIY